MQPVGCPLADVTVPIHSTSCLSNCLFSVRLAPAQQQPCCLPHNCFSFPIVVPTLLHPVRQQASVSFLFLLAPSRYYTQRPLQQATSRPARTYTKGSMSRARKLALSLPLLPTEASTSLSPYITASFPLLGYSHLHASSLTQLTPSLSLFVVLSTSRSSSKERLQASAYKEPKRRCFGGGHC